MTTFEQFVTGLCMAALASAALYAPAFAFEAETLHSYKDWSVDIEIHDSGQLSCSAYTINRDADRFDFTVAENDNPSILMMFPEGIDGEFVADLNLYIDGQKFGFADFNFFPLGTDGAGALFVFADRMDARDFLVSLVSGREMVLTNSDASLRFATWSLAGSYAAAEQLAECRQRIGGFPA